MQKDSCGWSSSCFQSWGHSRKSLGRAWLLHFGEHLRKHLEGLDCCCTCGQAIVIGTQSTLKISISVLKGGMDMRCVPGLFQLSYPVFP
jgi:hypothetical protein